MRPYHGLGDFAKRCKLTLTFFFDLYSLDHNIAPSEPIRVFHVYEISKHSKMNMIVSDFRA